MQMMNVLKPIAFDVVICMSQLFDYYLFAVSITFICYEQYLYQIRNKDYTQTTDKWPKE